MNRIPILIAFLSSAPAFAMVEEEQSIRQRPLVLDDGELDAHGGLRLVLLAEPDVELADFVGIPIGVAYGLGHDLEVGLEVSTTWRPSFSLAFTPRARYAFSDMLAVGLSFAMPFGFISDRLGPRGLPLRLEVPAFRYESSAGAVQASVGWLWAFQEGDDTQALDANLAGIVGLGTSAFLVADVGLTVYEGFDAVSLESSTEVSLGAGLGLGWEITRRDILKLHVYTHDFIDIYDVRFALFFVHRWGQVEETASPDDWL